MGPGTICWRCPVLAFGLIRVAKTSRIASSAAAVSPGVEVVGETLDRVTVVGVRGRAVVDVGGIVVGVGSVVLTSIVVEVDPVVVGLRPELRMTVDPDPVQAEIATRAVTNMETTNRSCALRVTESE